MNEIDLFTRLTAALTKSGIPYMLTGSFASSFHGVPRASNDFDFVIAPTEQQLLKLKNTLSDTEYYFDLDDAPDAPAISAPIQRHRSGDWMEGRFHYSQIAALQHHRIRAEIRGRIRRAAALHCATGGCHYREA
jgi:hypothetical protein